MDKHNKSNPVKKPILWKDIGLVLLIKGILFFFLWLIFFSNPNSKHINSNQAYVDHILSQDTAVQIKGNS